MKTVRDYPSIVIPPPGPKAQAVVRQDAQWTSTCYTKEYPLVVSRGSGVMVEDVDGNRYLDFMAGIAVSSTGYGHPKVVAAVKKAAERFLHICGSDFYYEGMAALCERLARLAPGSSKKRVFLTNSGTEATEAAIKLVRHATGRTAIIAFRGAFHGRTTGAVSLTSSKARQHAGFGEGSLVFPASIGRGARLSRRGSPLHHPLPQCPLGNDLRLRQRSLVQSILANI